MAVSLPAIHDNLNANTNKTSYWGSRDPRAIARNNSGIDLDEQGMSSSLATGYAGVIWQFNSGVTIDATADDNIFILGVSAVYNTACEIETIANHGMTMRLYTGGYTNFVEWDMSGQDATGTFIMRDRYKPFIVDPEATVDSTGGSGLTSASIDYWAIGGTYDGVLGGTRGTMIYSRFVIMGTTKDSTDIPRLYDTCDLKDLYAAVASNDAYDRNHVYVDRLGDSYFYACPFVIGYGSIGATATYFDDEGITVISPTSNASQDPRFRLSDNAMRVYIDAKDTNDTFEFSGKYFWGTSADWDFGTSADVTLVNAWFEGMGDFTMGCGVSGYATWKNCDNVIICASAEIDDSTFDGCDKVTLSGDGAELENCIIKNADTYGLVIETAGTYTLTNCTFTDNPSDIRFENASGTATVHIIGGTFSPSISNGGSGYEIRHPVSVEIDGFDSGASVRVELQSDTSQTIINEEDVSGTSISNDDYDYEADTPVYIKVRQSSSTDATRYHSYKQEATVLVDGLFVTVSMVEDSVVDWSG